MSDLIEVRRAKFEATESLRYYLASVIKGAEYFSGGEYVEPGIQSAWEWWNAALDSAVVELPNSDKAMLLVLGYQENINTNVTGTANWAVGIGAHIVSACADAIRAAGVPTK